MYPPPGQYENPQENQPQYGFPPPTGQPGSYPPPNYPPPQGTNQQPPPQNGFQQQGYGYQQPPGYYQPQYVRTPVGLNNRRTGLRLLIFLVFFLVIFGAIGYFSWNIFNQATGVIKTVANSTGELSLYPGAVKLNLKDSYKSTITNFPNLKIEVYATEDSPDKIADFFYNKEFDQKGYNVAMTDTSTPSRGFARLLQGFGSNGARAEVRILTPAAISDAISDSAQTQNKTVFVVLSSNPLEGVFK
jgi:hypothetical protein